MRDRLAEQACCPLIMMGIGRESCFSQCRVSGYLQIEEAFSSPCHGWGPASLHRHRSSEVRPGPDAGRNVAYVSSRTLRQIKPKYVNFRMGDEVHPKP